MVEHVLNLQFLKYTQWHKKPRSFDMTFKFFSFSLSNQKQVGKIAWLSKKIHTYEMLPEVKLKPKKQLGNLFATENDGLSRHEK